MVYPLFPGDPQTIKRLPKLVGKKVIVQGKYYDSTEMIVAGDIRSRA